MKKLFSALLCLAMTVTLLAGSFPAAAAEAPDHSEQIRLTVAYNLKHATPIPDGILDQVLLEKFNIVVEWKDLEDKDFKTNVTLQMAGRETTASRRS